MRVFCFATAPFALLLLGCGSGDDGPGAAGMTVGENQRLEEASERLEARTPSPARESAAQLEADVAAGVETDAQAAPPQ